ncbi:MAG: hypothetical protein COA79_10765 [Planctomycetota bacterium]|nr:MAG: hypothetical protein COA79_10765 [Planctomycetota bacterium]
MSAIKTEEKKIELIEKSAVLFAQKGYQAVTVSEIVEFLGISKGGLYWYFKSKEELYISICDYFCQKNQVMIQKQFQAIPQNKEECIEVLVQLYRTIINDELMIGLMVDLHAELQNSDRVKETLKSNHTNWVKTVQLVFNQLVGLGIFEKYESSMKYENACVIFYEGLIMKYSIFRDEEDTVRDLRQFVNIFFPWKKVKG